MGSGAGKAATHLVDRGLCIQVHLVLTKAKLYKWLRMEAGEFGARLTRVRQCLGKITQESSAHGYREQSKRQQCCVHHAVDERDERALERNAIASFETVNTIPVCVCESWLEKYTSSIDKVLRA